MNKFAVMIAGAALSLTLAASAFAQDTQPATPESAPAAAQAEPAKPADAASPAADAAPAAAAAPAAEAVPAAEPASAAAPASAASAGSEKGKIVFFRPSRLAGAIYTYHIVEVGDDGKPAKGAPELGDLPNGGAFVLEVEPGVHAYNITGPMAVNKAEDRLRMEVEPGETYYVEQTVRIGMVTGGFRLVPADEARFTQSKAKLGKGQKAQKGQP